MKMTKEGVEASMLVIWGDKEVWNPAPARGKIACFGVWESIGMWDRMGLVIDLI